jgi:hypothetical protein
MWAIFGAVSATLAEIGTILRSYGNAAQVHPGAERGQRADDQGTPALRATSWAE